MLVEHCIQYACTRYSVQARLLGARDSEGLFLCAAHQRPLMSPVDLHWYFFEPWYMFRGANSPVSGRMFPGNVSGKCFREMSPRYMFPTQKIFPSACFREIFPGTCFREMFPGICFQECFRAHVSSTCFSAHVSGQMFSRAVSQWIPLHAWCAASLSVEPVENFEARVLYTQLSIARML